MGLMRKPMLMRQKARFEHTLQDRLSFLSGKGVKSPKAEKDTIVRKLQADLKAVNKRLRVITASEKRTEEMAKIKAERAAAPKQEQDGGKGEKPKKAAGDGKEKKIKKAPEGGKVQKTAESPEEGKAKTKKKAEEAGEEPAGPAKAEK
jgi:translation initiation factor IF-2